LDLEDLMHAAVHRSTSTVQGRPMEAGRKAKNVQLKGNSFQICEGHFLMVEENSNRILACVFHPKK